MVTPHHFFATRDCFAIARKGPEAGQRQARGRHEAGMNEEASAGDEDVQNRPTIFRKGRADS